MIEQHRCLSGRRTTYGPQRLPGRSCRSPGGNRRRRALSFLDPLAIPVIGEPRHGDGQAVRRRDDGQAIFNVPCEVERNR